MVDFADPERAALVRAALDWRVDYWATAQGSIVLPAVPAMAGRFADKCAAIFAALGRAFADAEREQLESVLRSQLEEAYAESQRSSVTVEYRCGHLGGIEYEVAVNVMTIEDAYNHWIATREPPFFGTEPDARVLALAAEADDPRACRVLDIGREPAATV